MDRSDPLTDFRYYAHQLLIAFKSPSKSGHGFGIRANLLRTAKGAKRFGILVRVEALNSPTETKPIAEGHSPMRGGYAGPLRGPPNQTPRPPPPPPVSRPP